jgi:NAD+ synthase (glutamine-hydrolysing)
LREIVLALAQVNTAVGDIEGNSSKILEYAGRAQDEGADLVIFPELCLTGYPPEDLLLKQEFIQESMTAIRSIALEVGDIIAVVGFVEGDYDIFNSAAVLTRGRLACTYRKTFLPNYGVFDEKRYFGAGTSQVVLDVGGIRVGVSICEDIWFPGGPVEGEVARGGAELVVNLSASPFNRGKHEYRERLVASRSMDGPAVVAYVNNVGAQDELVFDGGSCVYHPQHGFLAKAPRFRESLLVCRVDLGTLRSERMLEPRFRYSTASYPLETVSVCNLERPERNRGSTRSTPPYEEPRPLSPVEEIFEALVLGLGEYVLDNGFEKVVLGLSGGIDSALTAALAVEALGRDNVVCVFLPSRYTSEQSRRAARELADNLGVRLMTVPIDGVFQSYIDSLAPEMGGSVEGPVFENVQARIRGNILMALSNRQGWLVLATGNKSELSMGYCTLYGDMAGGFALIKDLLKTQVYEVSGYLNLRAGRELIPQEVIDRPPTAELKDGQLDTDSLPPYEELDPVLEAYVEEVRSLRDIVDMGFSEDLVERVIRAVDANEYKRRQAPVGVKITSRAFGRDWRMPISSPAKLRSSRPR